MDSSTLLEILLKLLAALALVLMNAFFVASEFALVKVRETQLDTLIAKGQRRAAITKRVISKLDASLSACQLGVTIASLALGWVGEPVFSAVLSPIWPLLGVDDPGSAHTRETISVLVGFGTITFLHITAGEQAAKWLAIQRPLPVALFVSRPLEIFHFVSYPFIWLLNQSSLWILRQLGLQPRGAHDSVQSEEELRLLLAAPAQRTSEMAFSRHLALNAFDLAHRKVCEVMRPRREMVVLNTESNIEECLNIAETSRYSRFPLCEGGDLDKTLGVVHIKDLYALRNKARRGGDLRRAAKRLIYVPETARLERVLKLFLDERLHFAIVVDEYGGTVGMLTLENILEELVGQIQDEFDQEKPMVVARGDRVWELDGILPLHELANLVGEPLHEEGVTTTSGFVTQRLGGFPKPGDRVVIGRCELFVEEVDGPRVTRLRLTKRAPEQA
jgi:CBS domain containing-hemolysin-like protein